MGFINWIKGGDSVALHHDTSLEDIIISAALQDVWSSDSLALSVAAVYRARVLLADSLSSLSLTSGESLVPAPNRSQDWEQFIAELMLSMQDSGDGYIHLDGTNLYVLPHKEMKVNWSEWAGFRRQRIYKFRDTVMRTEGMTPNLVVVSVNRSTSDLTGYGWIENPAILGIIAAQRYSDEYFKNNAQPSGVLKVPAMMSESEAKLLKQQWDNNHQTRQTAVISQAMDYQATSFNANDSQMVDNHLANIGDVANLSGVPSYLLAYSPPGSTQDYQNVESVLVRLWRETLWPTYARRIEASLTRIYDQQIRFDPEPMFLSSLSVRTASLGELVRAGFDPEESADVVGLPRMTHTGFLPITLQQDEEVNSGIPTV